MTKVLTFDPVFFRTYSRTIGEGKESLADVIERVMQGFELGPKKVPEEFLQTIREEFEAMRMFPAGRMLWVAGTPWAASPENYPGAYNCESTFLDSPGKFGLSMDFAMQGVGTGLVLEDWCVAKLPKVSTKIEVEVVGEFGAEDSRSFTFVEWSSTDVVIHVGDSRKGWVVAYQQLIDLAFAIHEPRKVTVDVSAVRKRGERLKGFGGVANPADLKHCFKRVGQTLAKAHGRQLTPIECCLLVDEAAKAVVAGNVRRSAGMRQFSATNKEAAKAKDDLWIQGEDGWSIDPERDALRMANHTRVFHTRPGFSEIVASVAKQYMSGEGAIQFAPEAIARANADLLRTHYEQSNFIERYCIDMDSAFEYLEYQAEKIGIVLAPGELDHRMRRYGLNPCGEICGADFFCNLGEVHLNNLDPLDSAGQARAFNAAGYATALYLWQGFASPVHQRSRELDPIVGVSFTGLFDFFVELFGVQWLKWWEAGRPTEWVPELEEIESLNEKLQDILDMTGGWSNDVVVNISENTAMDFRYIEQEFLGLWREEARLGVEEVCEAMGYRLPNRVTTVQPAGCLDRDAIRVFDQGILYADEIVEPGSGRTDSLPLSVRGGIGAGTALANDPVELVKVEFRNGRTLRMTPNHRLSVGGSWIRADEMTAGMIVDSSLGKYSKSENALLLSVNPFDYTREARMIERGHSRGVLTATIVTPSTMSPDLAYFIGAMFANGCMSESPSRVRFSHSYDTVLEKLGRIGESLFGIAPTICQSRGRVAKELVFSSGQLFDWLKLNNLSKDVKSLGLGRMPEAIRRSSRECILSFFAGMIDCDGCPRNNSFSIDLASEEMIRHLQQVGEAVGLSFSVSHNTKGDNFQAEKSIWSAHLSRMKSEPDAVAFLNKNSIKLQSRPVLDCKRHFRFEPYEITSVLHEKGIPDFTYEFVVEGANDDDDWYWQGGLKSHNSKSLLTGATSGWHPPKSARYIRRITFAKNDPVALACLDMGYSVVPGQSDTDESGKLLDDPFDDRCTEWLIEIPVELPWASIPGADRIDPSKFSALAQFDFYMQVQQHYTEHNTSATLELTEDEIRPLAERIWEAIQHDEGYISSALLARFDAGSGAFPRLPFEPISKETYDSMVGAMGQKATEEDFAIALKKHQQSEALEAGPMGCDSDKCLVGGAPNA